MANWESQRPPRTSSRWQPPGIFLNVEFGVSLGPDRRAHTTGVKYTSRRMEQRLHEERVRRQHEGGYYSQQASELQQLATLGALMPGPGDSGEHGDSYQPERQTRYQQQERQRRLGVRTRVQHERGTSAPPSLMDHNQPVSPVTSPEFTSPMTVNYFPHVAPIQHTPSMPLERTKTQSLSFERTKQPLPPTPSQFRLGEEDMPWSNPPWYRSTEQPDIETQPLISMDQDNGHKEDPQRVAEMEALHSAMMTVDSLGHDVWEPWTWDSVGDMPRGPRSIGWAVSSRDAPPGSSPKPAPPPYVVSQWEQAYGGRNYGRPRSAHS